MPFPDITTLDVLSGPYEIFDLGRGGARDLRITEYKVGRMTIHPRPAGVPKEIVALRVWVPETIKTLYPDWYDITSQTLIAQLLPHLEAGDYKRKRFTITKYGAGPTARFSLSVTPL